MNFVTHISGRRSVMTPDVLSTADKILDHLDSDSPLAADQLSVVLTSDLSNSSTAKATDRTTLVGRTFVAIEKV